MSARLSPTDRAALALVLLLSAFLLAPSLLATPLQPAYLTYYVSDASGADTNPGTSAAPWKTMQKAAASLHSGDTVEIGAGIYNVPDWPFLFKPAGTPGHLTTYRAAPGARVILRDGATDKPPEVTVLDYVGLDGLWMGGVYNATSTRTAQMTGTGLEIVNCTFFGYVQGPMIGHGENMLFQNNRLVDNGKDVWSHGAYYSSGTASAGALTNHIIIDNNIFVGKAGYGFQGWHGPKNLIMTRNFVAGHMWGMALDGTDSLIANNMFWQENGFPTNSPPLAPWGAFINNYPNVLINNISGPHAWVSIGNSSTVLPKLTVGNNAFTDEPPPAGLGGCAVKCGASPLVLHRGQELQELGTTAADLNQAIAALQAAFLQPVATLYTDPSIDSNFARLKLTIPTTSPLYQTGRPWFGQTVNVGPDSSAPQTAADFWAAFRALGIKEYDHSGNVVNGGSVTTPTQTSAPSSTPSAAPSTVPSNTAAPSATATQCPPSATPSQTATTAPSATATRTSTVAPSATPTQTATIVPSATATRKATATPKRTATPRHPHSDIPLILNETDGVGTLP